MGIFDRNKKNDGIKLPRGYKIPDCCDIDIYCKYTNELDIYFDKELIKQFFKEHQKNVNVVVRDRIEKYDENFKSIYIIDECIDSALVSFDWDIFDDDLKKNEINFLEALRYHKDLINIINQCDSILSFQCRAKEEVMWVLYLSLYMSKYTDSIIVHEDSEGLYFKPLENELVKMKKNK